MKKYTKYISGKENITVQNDHFQSIYHALFIFHRNNNNNNNNNNNSSTGQRHKKQSYQSENR